MRCDLLVVGSGLGEEGRGLLVGEYSKKRNESGSRHRSKATLKRKKRRENAVPELFILIQGPLSFLFSLFSFSNWSRVAGSPWLVVCNMIAFEKGCVRMKEDKMCVGVSEVKQARVNKRKRRLVRSNAKHPLVTPEWRNARVA